MKQALEVDKYLVFPSLSMAKILMLFNFMALGMIKIALITINSGQLNGYHRTFKSTNVTFEG